MHRLAATDLWAGLFCITVAGVALLLLSDLRMGTLAAMGPAFLPTWLARILAGIGFLIALRSIASSARLIIDWRVLRPLLLILGAIVFFAVALRIAGFAVTAFVLLLMASAAGREFRWREGLIIAAAVSAIASAIFIVGLKINIPLWPAP